VLAQAKPSAAEQGCAACLHLPCLGHQDIPPGVCAAPGGGFSRPGGQAGVAQAGQALQCHWSPEQQHIIVHDLLLRLLPLQLVVAQTLASVEAPVPLAADPSRPRKGLSQLVVIVGIRTCSTSLTRVHNWNDGQHQRQLKCVNVACDIMLVTLKTLTYCGCRMRG
jgi:hypothetical protein